VGDRKYTLIIGGAQLISESLSKCTLKKVKCFEMNVVVKNLDGRQVMGVPEEPTHATSHTQSRSEVEAMKVESATSERTRLKSKAMPIVVTTTMVTMFKLSAFGFMRGLP
jgi:hypothetical protein